MNIFSYPGKPEEIRETGKKVVGDLRESLLSFPSWVNTPYPENNRVYLEIMEPENPQAAILVIHPWMEGNYGYSKKLSYAIARENFISVRMHLPYHLKRTPAGTSNGALFLTLDLETSLDSFVQSVIDLRTSIDILQEKYPGLNIGAAGISLGAIILLTLMAVEKRIHCGVSILGAGNITDIVAKGAGTIPLIISAYRKGLRWRHYQQVRQEFEDFLSEVRKKGLDGVKPPRWKWFLFDPLTYAEKNRKILFINALFDL
ncbi:MAG: hypothetical protein GXO71_07185, partial [Caldiserica bacterium]|nr:hypothetical protein [Caldisericota bacterium]